MISHRTHTASPTVHGTHSPLAAVEWDHEGRVTRWSPQAEELFGWRADEVLGKRVDEWPFVHPDDLEAVARRSAGLVWGGERQNLSSNRNLTRDGRVLFCEWYNTAVLDEQGRLAAHLSLVLDVTARVRAQEEAEAARLRAEHAADRIRRLQEVTAALSEALTPTEVARVVMDQGITALGADAGVIALTARAGEELEIADSRGYRDERTRPWRRFPLATPVPIAEAARTGEVIVLRSQEEREARYPTLAPHPSDYPMSVSVPLVVEGEPLGAMGLSFAVAHDFGEEDRSFLVALARQCAQAVRRSTLYLAERAARQEAERLEERLRLALESAAIGTWDFHPVTGTLVWDARCRAVFGFGPEAHVDYDAFLTAVHPEDRERADEVVRRALDPAGDGRCHAQYRVLWPDGTVRWAMARGRAFFEGEGGERRATRFVGTILDVTARREAEAERSRLYEEALAASRAKTSFLATMSHELRTPLNAVIGYADLLLAGIPEEIPGRARGQVERIDQASRHLLSIIEEILTFSRIDAGREVVSPERIDLRELVREVCSIAEPLADGRRLRFRAPETVRPEVVVTDPRKLRQILINLVGNAVKFTENGEIVLAVEADGAWLVFRVSDTGIGIAPEHLETIFEPFRQVDQGTTRSVGGTGLGLAVSRELARLLGGEVEVRSEPGQGSTFTVRLPLVA
ncbi:MAG: PAS domain S-box protein [Gemmatimonadetes bacterium]|nr:PAS domain S-box protein [Gemmatimonadota bacterium]